MNECTGTVLFFMNERKNVQGGMLHTPTITVEFVGRGLDQGQTKPPAVRTLELLL